MKSGSQRKQSVAVVVVVNTEPDSSLETTVTGRVNDSQLRLLTNKVQIIHPVGIQTFNLQPSLVVYASVHIAQRNQLAL
jgi:hypothetical protein